MKKEEYLEKIEDVEDISIEEVSQFVENMDFEDTYDKLYLAFLMQNNVYEPEGNLSMSQIFSMNSLDVSLSIKDIQSLETWETSEFNEYIKKKREDVSVNDLEEILNYGAGICICLDEHCDEIDNYIKENKDIDTIIIDFENNPAKDAFMSERKTRDLIKGIDTPEFEQLKETYIDDLKEKEEILEEVDEMVMEK